MDGVLADFEKAAGHEGIHPKQFKGIHGAYAMLPVITGAQEAVERVIKMGYESFVCTKIPDENPSAATDKIWWIKKKFPMLHGRVFIVPDKGAIGRPCDFLIDDHLEWANAHNFPGTKIPFNGDWDTIFNVLPNYKG